jgi:Alpha/beta hydrolase of unknown function (DUF900)
MSNTLCKLVKSRLLFLVFFSSFIFMTTTTQQSSSFQPTAATLSSITLPQDEGDNEQQGQEQTDTALGNQMELLAPSNTTINNATSPNDLMFDTRQCLGEWAIYIHGIWTDRDAAIEQAGRIDLSLPSDKKIPIFVFLWKGDTALNSFGWDEAKDNADAAGHELADVIAESKSACPSDKIRLIAWSLGSRVVLSGLDSLENNSRWKEEGFNITSVHLMGAAVDDEKISKNQFDIDHGLFDDGKVYGNAIERNVLKFYNLYNPEDDMLERVDQIEEQTDDQPRFYPRFEIDDALGSLGIQQASIDERDIPSNYQEQNVQNEILAIEDADAGAINEAPFPECDVISYIVPFNCTISATVLGDNHLGYMGFRDSTNSSRLIPDGGDGAINVVVSDWQTN